MLGTVWAPLDLCERKGLKQSPLTVCNRSTPQKLGFLQMSIPLTHGDSLKTYFLNLVFKNTTSPITLQPTQERTQPLTFISGTPFSPRLPSPRSLFPPELTQNRGFITCSCERFSIIECTWASFCLLLNFMESASYHISKCIFLETGSFLASKQERARWRKRLPPPNPQVRGKVSAWAGAGWGG